MPSYPAIKLRLILAPETMFGPGKAALLQGIQETGSIAAASRRMGMSYKRAWYLIDTLNGYFEGPLVVSSKGGTSGGGAQLTERGQQVLSIFLRMEAKVARAVKSEMAILAKMAAK
jgi:molybdate transport system regulatory protein